MRPAEVFGVDLDNGRRLYNEFSAADPFPLIVIDDFLDLEFANALADEFPSPEQMPKSRDYIFGNKRELSSVGEHGTVGSRYRESLLSTEFAQFLNELTGHTGLFIDPQFHGGGYHQGGNGSFLDMHVDFNMHPIKKDWLRTVNVLLYLSKGWRNEWGGELQVKSGPEGALRRFSPTFNRAIIMVTNDSTFHGYEQMTLPDGVTRKSIAAYAYQIVDPGDYMHRTTGWAADHSNPLKNLIAKNYNSMVTVKNKVFGSSTARNR